MSMFSTLFMANIQELLSKLEGTNQQMPKSTMFKLHRQNSSTQESTSQKISESTSNEREEQPNSSSAFPNLRAKKESKTSNFSNAFRIDLKPSSPFTKNPSSPFSKNPSNPFFQNLSISNLDLDSVFVSDGEDIFIIDKRQVEHLKKRDSEEFGVNHEKSECTFTNFWKRKTSYSKDSSPHANFPDYFSKRKDRRKEETSSEDFFSKPFSTEEMGFTPSYDSKRRDLFMEDIDPTFLNVNLLTDNSLFDNNIFNKQECTNLYDELQQSDVFHDAYDDLQHPYEESVEENTERLSDYEDACDHTDNNLPPHTDCLDEKYANKPEAGDSIQSVDQLHPSSASYDSESLKTKDCFSDISRSSSKHNPFNEPSIASTDNWTAELLGELETDTIEHILRYFLSRKNKNIDMSMGDPPSATYAPATLSQTVGVAQISIPNIEVKDTFSSINANTAITESKHMSDIEEEEEITSCFFQNVDYVQTEDSSNSEITNYVQMQQESIMFDSEDSQYICQTVSASYEETEFENSTCNSSTSSHETENTPSLTYTEELELVKEQSEECELQPQLIQFYDDNMKQNRNVLLYTNQALETVCKQFKDEVSASKIWNVLIQNSITFGSTKIRGVVDLKLKNIIPPQPYHNEFKSTTLWKRFRKPLKSVVLMMDLVTVDKVLESNFVSSRFLKKFREFATHEDRFKSGFVITKSKSNLWLTEAGLYSDGQLNPTFASKCFEQYAERRLVINPYDYMLYLVKMAHRCGIDINLMYDRMIASKPPSPKGSAHRQSKSSIM